MTKQKKKKKKPLRFIFHQDSSNIFVMCNLLLMVKFLGTSKIQNLHENIGCLKVKLTKDDQKEISDALPPTEVAGKSISDALYAVTWKFANTPHPSK